MMNKLEPHLYESKTYTQNSNPLTEWFLGEFANGLRLIANHGLSKHSAGFISVFRNGRRSVFYSIDELPEEFNDMIPKILSACRDKGILIWFSDGNTHEFFDLKSGGSCD